MKNEWLNFEHKKEGFVLLISKEGIPLVFKAKDVQYKIKLGCQIQNTLFNKENKTDVNCPNCEEIKKVDPDHCGRCIRQ